MNIPELPLHSLMLTRAEVSLSVLVKAALDLLTFQLINLHAVNPHAAK